MTPSVYAAEAETNVMGAGNTQLEFKLGVVRDTASDTRVRFTPFLARLGITESVELRLSADGRVVSKSAGVTTKGWADANIGLRWQQSALDEKAGTAGVAWQFDVGIPTGTQAFSSDKVASSAKVAAEWAFANDMSLGVMPGLSRQHNGTDWYVAPSLAITLGKNWTPQLRTVAELVAPQLTSRSNGGNVATFNLGATYSLSDTFELEAVYLRGLTSNTPDHTLVFGVNVKF